LQSTVIRTGIGRVHCGGQGCPTNSIVYGQQRDSDTEWTSET
jgi:hypothetical protein